jgi:hypothetical protein
MSLLKLLLHPRAIRVAIWFFVVATPLAGTILALWAARRAASDANANRYGLARNPLFWVLSASGPLVRILWIVFNAIENALGLDSIAGFLINVGLFCMVGFGLSLFLWYGRRWLRPGGRRSAPVMKQP